ncbi:MAG TPA: serine/threonine-protein kinase [Gemmataceae bacterium]|nr:serine/threonine-protein kinase [Gemmataceae bacterium]
MGLDLSRAAMQSVGNYDLLEKIAEGGMGAIWKGRSRISGETVAVKIMPSHMAANPVLLKRFEQEFRAASRLDHPNIVRALDYGESGNTPYLVMEFVEGESLGQRIERGGAMSETEAIRIIAQVAQGLHRAHKQNLVHRDVKPDNILVTPDGTAKLADLGLVKETDADLNLTKTGRGLGTPHFMAPEQFRNAKNADPRCDIYSLGATLYQMVTGELPFRSTGPLEAWMKKVQNELTPPRKIVPGLSERVDWAIRRAMAVQPDHRPGSCREFVEDLTGHSTRRLPTAEADTSAAELWYLVYVDEAGEKHTVKGSTAAIRRSLKEGLLGDAANVLASRSKAGPFDMLQAYPEFRDMVLAALLPGDAAPAAPPAAPSAQTPLPPAVSSPGTRTKSSRRDATMPPPSRPEPASPAPAPAPHINLGSAPRLAAPSGNWEVLKWLLLIGVAAGAALAAFYLLPEGWFHLWK